MFDYGFAVQGLIISIALICIGAMFSLEGVSASIPDYLDPTMQNITIKAPPYKGKTYKAMVPDTLDLAERAKLAINAMTRTLDPAHNYEMYFIADLADNPPMQIHEASSLPCETKYLEALPLCRIMSGSHFNENIDRILMEKYVHNTGKDGFFYGPVEGRPWHNKDPFGRVYAPEEPYIQSFTEGRGILAMTVWYQRDKNPLWKRLCERKIDHFMEVGTRDGDTISFSPFYTVTDGKSKGSYWATYGPIRYARMTDYKPAHEMARLYANGLQNRYFGNDGNFKPGNPQHCTALSIIDMMEYANLVGDQKMMALVKKAYEEFRTSKLGANDLVGFIGEGTMEGYASSEGCGVADMVVLALKLSQYGVGDYWDDADRYIRNMFTEMQMTNSDWVEFGRPAALPQNYIDKIADQHTASEKYPGMTDTDGVADKCVGAWAGWAVGNDGMCLGHEHNQRPFTFMHCCTGNGARTLYFAWDSILTGDEKDMKVNLLLNRASAWMDVNSYIPYEGRVDLLVKKPIKKLEVRIPEWVKPEETACTVNGKAKKLTFSGRYAQVGGVEKGDTVVVTFPISIRQVKTKIGGIDYKLDIKGNEVIAISPRGQWWPFYQKEYYRQNEVRWVNRERFVSNERTEW